MQITPIGILSFNRPEFLQKTLASLASQPSLADREIHLFQDGGFNPLSGRKYADEGLIDENIALFKRYFPSGVVHRQSENVSIARQFDLMERYFFEFNSFEAAIFLEDDMVLGPHYLTILDSLLIPEALRNEHIGAVAAYGNHLVSAVEQLGQLPKVVEMHHRWAFATTRRQWLRQRPYMEEYLAIIADTDYQCRNHYAIVDWFLAHKIMPPVTSQDGVKGAIMTLTGALALMTQACYAQYIGKVGVHFREDVFEQAAFHKTQLCPVLPTHLEWPSSAEMEVRLVELREMLSQNVKHVMHFFPWYANRPDVKF
jgi:hypothetical protein